ncbi:MAG: hypothetical protein SF002_15440 [Alphaproteobacteria bacterium]|nr:hypothetical protein [Alphaproteobacteria bacterium]
MSLDLQEHSPLRQRPQPSPAIAALDQEIRGRYAKRTGTLASFLQQWIRLDASQEQFFSARGTNGENYLQYVLSQWDTTMALGVAETCLIFAESTAAGPVIDFLNHIDAKGSDIWHYLAENLRRSEDDETLAIARILIKLEVDYCRKNNEDESPLGRLLVPEVKWNSINALLAAKTVTLDEIEASFPDRLAANPTLKAEVVVGIFNSDLSDNEGKLIRTMLADVLSPRAERPEREKLARAFFDYVGGRRAETVLMRVVETDHKDVLSEMLRLLQVSAEENNLAVAAGDQQEARANQQIFMYRRLGKRSKVFQNAIMKAVMADRPVYVSQLLGLLRMEEVAIARRNMKGGTDREVITVDKASPAPANPALSLLLQQDARGNTGWHLSVLHGRPECLRKLLFGLSFIDTLTVLTRIPNRYNLTVVDLTSIKDAHVKLAQEVKAQRMSLEDAQTWLTNIKVVDKRIVEFLTDLLRKADDAMSRTGGGATLKPSFDLARIPTIQFLIKEGVNMAPRPTGAAQR